MPSPVTTGTQKLVMNSAEADYRSKRAAAMAQQVNPYMSGVVDVYKEGPAQAVKDSRTEYGAPTVAHNSVMQGKMSNFEQKDTPGNRPTNNYERQTGSVELGTSATKSANRDMEDVNSEELDRRLALYAKAGSNAGVNYNNPSAIYNI